MLDENPQLYFHLQQQKLIELIRKGQIAEALTFAQEELAPQGEESVCNKKAKKGGKLRPSMFSHNTWMN